MTDHRVYPALISKQQLLETSSSVVVNFPRQPDQPPDLDWQVLGDYDKFLPYSQLIESFTGSLQKQGLGYLDWELWLSPGMLAYLRELLLDADLSNGNSGKRSTEATILTFDSLTFNDWIALWVTLQLNESDIKREGPLWRTPIHLVEARLAPNGVDLTPALIIPNEWVLDDPYSIDLTISNIGDNSTSSPTVVTIDMTDMPLDFTLSLVAGVTVIYTPNGGTPSTPPIDRSTLTEIELTYPLSISIGDFSLGTMDGTANISGAVSMPVSLATDFETDDLNNSHTYMWEVS